MPDSPRSTRIRLDLAYDGTQFSGWARQPELRTVQGELERALAVVLRRDEHAVRVTVGGRTDAGVHARGQVCHLDVTADELGRLARTDPEGLTTLRIRALNGALRSHGADDLVVQRLRVVSQNFDARFSALSRRYEYRLQMETTRVDPLARYYTVAVPYVLDVDLMQSYSQSLLGLQDFAAFCKAREGATTIRTLQRFTWAEGADRVLTARLEADAFCHSMVRSLVGALVTLGSGRVSAEELDRLVAARARSSRFPVMPARGLSLEEIRYPSDDELAARAEQTRARRAALDEFPLSCVR